MVLSSTIQATLSRYQREVNSALRAAVTEIATREGARYLGPFYGQMQYHLGWVDADFTPAKSNPGKLLRPTLLLLAYEAAGAWGLSTDPVQTNHIQRALPAAISVELIHNFSLIHDDIEDGDAERRHRSTLWKLWGVPQAINTGDGVFSLARLALWKVLDKGVEGNIAARLGKVLDRTCLILSEGQYLDISFEQRLDISVALYLDMISRKTAALMACAAEMGAMLGTRDQETISRLQSFGKTIGVAFQLRDDILGIWATSAELGKTPAGDIYRRKKSLPILHALEHAEEQERNHLEEIYQQEGSVTPEQAEVVLSIMEHTQTKAYCRDFLLKYCQSAHEALASVPRTNNSVAARAITDMETLVNFLEDITH